nr:PREDICTED: transcription factor 7-like 1-B [Stegastes partitus]
MDLSTEIERVVMWMELGQVDPTLDFFMNKMLGGAWGAEPAADNQTTAACPVFEQEASLRAAPASPQPAHMYSQVGTVSQGQNVPVIEIPEDMKQNMRPIGFLNGKVLYELVFPAPTVRPSKSQKRKCDNRQDNRPYIKKPPNAFMLYLKEQRANVVADQKVKDSAAVNTLLAERWRSLTEEQQAKYYEQAKTLKLVHAQQHPDWSANDNYGKKRKRRRIRKSSTAASSLTEPAEETPQAKKPHLSVTEDEKITSEQLDS